MLIQGSRRASGSKLLADPGKLSSSYLAVSSVAVSYPSNKLPKVRFSLATIAFDRESAQMSQILSSQGKNAPSNPYPHYLVRLATSRKGALEKGICIKLSEIDFQIRDNVATPFL